MRSALASVLVALVLMGWLPASAAEAQTRGEGYADTAHSTTNQRRVNADLGPLEKDACLRRVAMNQAQAMAERGRMFHQDLGRVQRRCDMGWVGENVAFGFTTGKLVVKAWMLSPGHRANILSGQFQRMGIAAHRGNGVWWVAQVFGTRA
jgi:uncharacterized protein YkwD